MTMNHTKFCKFTVAAGLNCPVIIAIAHALYYHENEMSCRESHMQDLRRALRDLNAAFAEVDGIYPESVASQETGPTEEVPEDQ